MGDVEEPQFTSLSARIAALNQQHVANNQPGASMRSKSTVKQSVHEPIGVRNVLPPPVHKYTASGERREGDGEERYHREESRRADTQKMQPPLPQRNPPLSLSNSSINGTPKPSPALPPRKASQQQLVRRESNESLASMKSTISSISTLSLGPSITRRPSHDIDAGRLRGLPPPLSEAKLPPLPTSRRESKERELQRKAEKAANTRTTTDPPKPSLNPRPAPKVAKSMPQIPAIKAAPPSLPPRTSSQRPSVPPRSPNQVGGGLSPTLPPRPKTANNALSESRSTEQNTRKLPPVIPQRSALSWGMNKPTSERESGFPTRLDGNSSPEAPPPVPRSSRPSDFEIERILQAQASPKFSDDYCMKCRDFFAPDRVASQYPRESFPNMSTQYLADVLCGPFTSHTDKARAIFTWLHHTIAYDTVAFFGNNVQHATPETTLKSGVAVCGGYAGLFTAIALKAGLESIVISGHGKGFGYHALQPGEKCPPFSAGHAWNAVRIDHGEWKLIDPCWGAGHLSPGSQNYTKAFNPSNFTKSNEEFGLTHFPSDKSYFFRNDGRNLTWEEYYIGPGPLGVPNLQIFGDPGKDHGIDRESFLPKQKLIDVSHANPSSHTRFQFSKICQHWDHERHGPGKPYLMGLFINGIDGRGFNGGKDKNDFVLLRTSEDGFFSWADAENRVLGVAGQKVKLAVVMSLDGRDGRGVGGVEYLGGKGRVGMSWSFVAEWDLV